MDLTLVVLAAGAGTRYGGAKQLEPVSEGGATLMDYAVWDAARAGFGRVVIVARPEMEGLEQRYAGRMHATTVLQRLNDVPAGHRLPERDNPWGTAHALLAARDAVKGPFAVVNGDDFYGAAAYRSAALLLSEGSDDWGVAGYRLGDTLSSHGGVHRAICTVGPGNMLRSVDEVREIARTGGGSARGRGSDGPVVLSDQEIVSMNFWAFTPGVFAALRRAFEAFLDSPAAATAELLLPHVVQAELVAKRARVRVLDATSPGYRWFGITHPSDIASAREAIGRLIASGEYPGRPWA